MSKDREATAEAMCFASEKLKPRKVKKSFVIYRESGPVLLTNPIFLRFFRLLIRAWYFRQDMRKKSCAKPYLAALSELTEALFCFAAELERPYTAVFWLQYFVLTYIIVPCVKCENNFL